MKKIVTPIRIKFKMTIPTAKPIKISLNKDERREARLGSFVDLYLICKKY